MTLAVLTCEECVDSFKTIKEANEHENPQTICGTYFIEFLPGDKDE